MKSKILLFFWSIVIILITTSSVYDVADLCDSPVVGGHSGAPGSPGCEYCHGGSPNTGTGSVTFDLEMTSPI